MNYTTLGVINSSPQERTLSDSHNLSSVFITKFRSSQDDLLMGVLAKCGVNHQASSEDQCKQMDAEDATPGGDGVKSERKIKLSFSVDRLLEKEPSGVTAGDERSERSRFGRTNGLLEDCKNCSVGYQCCKYSHSTGIYMNSCNGFGVRSINMENVSVVRPLPIRMTNNINSGLQTPVSANFTGIAQLFKYQSTTTGSGCMNNLKSLQSATAQFHQDGASINNGTSSTPVSNGKRKRSWSRAVFSNLQRKGLEIQFQQQKYITKPDRRKLAARLNLTDAQVKVWFQNRRMKWRHTRENLKSGQEKATDEHPRSHDEAISSSDDEIDVVAE